MDDHEFWQLIYALAIHRGDDPCIALRKANEALTDYRHVEESD